MPRKPRTRRKERKNVPVGRAYISQLLITRLLLLLIPRATLFLGVVPVHLALLDLEKQLLLLLSVQQR